MILGWCSRKGDGMGKGLVGEGMPACLRSYKKADVAETQRARGCLTGRMVQPVPAGTSDHLSSG